jgi:hypothetical protein
MTVNPGCQHSSPARIIARFALEAVENSVRNSEYAFRTSPHSLHNASDRD